jgi:hypothetical protein
MMANKRWHETYWSMTVHSDSKGYYAYLPAVFIYQDLSFSFIKYYEGRYYEPAHYSYFTYYTGKGIVNKYWLGTSLVQIPFFFMGHLATRLSGFEPDGYSFWYLFFYSLGSIFWLNVALVYLFRLLISHINIHPLIAFSSALMICMGTNLFYYSTLEGSMSHVFSFCFINMFLFYSFQWFKQKEKTDLFKISFCLAIIFLIRPTNLIVLLALPFTASSLRSFLDGLGTIFLRPLVLITALFVFIIPASLQFLVYYLQTGSPVVYSYATEKFIFTRPEIFNWLFSYRKGLFVYTPITLISLTGIYYYFRKNSYQTLMLLIFSFAVLYLLSCWWMWWYGGSLGMRPAIDFYFVFAIFMAVALQELRKWYTKLVYSSLLFFGVSMSILYTYQYVNFILPWDEMNKDKYWTIFLKTDLSYAGKVFPE